MKKRIQSLLQSKFASIPLTAVALLLLMPLAAFSAGLFYIDSDTGFAGFGNTTPQAQVDVSGTIYSRLVTATSSAIDWNEANVQTMTLSSDPTLTFSNGHAGGLYTLILAQDATGGRAVTWPSSVLWAGGVLPVLTSTAHATDTASFIFDGAQYLGSFTRNYRDTSCGFGTYIGNGTCRGYLTAAGAHTWTVPSDWNSSSNTIEVIGGGSGGTGGGGTGGGGGAYSAVSDLALTPNDSIDYSIGAGGVGGTSSATGGGDTWFDGATFGAASVAAKGAHNGSGSSNLGGSAASGIGSTRYDGGDGALYCSSCDAGGGGGGSAGFHGAGNDAIRQSSQFGPGASADAGSGGGGGSTDGANGGDGSEWNATHGSGGGGAGSFIGNGGDGGLYGGGAGGGVYPGPSSGGDGAQGLIVITYTF